MEEQINTNAMSEGNIYVLAGSYKQALDFALKNHITRNKITYLTNAESVMGGRGGDYVKVGTWYKKDNNYVILNILTSAEFKDVTKNYNQ